MKKIGYILILVPLMFSSCWDSSVKLERPGHLPPNLPANWGATEHYAYQEGRLHYNEDSTICWIESDRKATKGHVERAKEWAEDYGTTLDTIK